MNTQPPIYPGNQTFADIANPGAADPQRPRTFFIAPGASPVALAPKDVRFEALQFVAQKADGTANAGDIQIKVRDMGADGLFTNTGNFKTAITLSPGSPPEDWNPPDNREYCGTDFQVVAANGTDGVQVFYS